MVDKIGKTENTVAEIALIQPERALHGLKYHRHFSQVVDSGSFTQAAENLELTKSTVSRKVAELEQHLGVRLITRSTRSLVLTQEGETFYQSCTQMLEIMSQAELEVSANQDLIRGRLNVVMPVELGHQVLGPTINAFLKAYPNVTIHLELTNRDVDVIGEGIDLYAQVGEVEDSSLVSRPLTASRRVLVASPAYLEQYGMVNSPADLVPPHHQIKVHNTAVKLPQWHFIQSGDLVSLDLPTVFGSILSPLHSVPVWTDWGSRCCLNSFVVPIWPKGIWCNCCRTGRCRWCQSVWCIRNAN
ncbi:transcriptional regulator LysR family homolog 4 [Photobacterium aphoticum]|uniref:Transcriptional regulator LysR family homolog 4 n=1 Tax=Photobacterium aphoticum TaxID=754436 RepID=A0A090QNN7_9GAMM|nr:transcriptional regulator LysR family homolog 4 [Photobacterium aphoticum]